MKIKNISSVTIRGLKPGKTIEINVDKFGMIKDIYWRRRQKDNDGSLEFIKEEVKKVCPKKSCKKAIPKIIKKEEKKGDNE